MDEDILYLACSDAGVDIIDISNPAQPIKIGNYHDNSGVAIDLLVKDNKIFVADADDGLEIIEIVITETIEKSTGFHFIGSMVLILLLIGIRKRNRIQ